MRPYDSDEEADRHAGLRTRALPVADGRTDGAFDFDAPPAISARVPARVRREAATVPDVMVADAAARARARVRMLSVPPPTPARAARLGEADALQTAPDAVTRKRFAASAPMLAAAAAAAPASAPRHARAAPAWRREFLAWFSDVRADVARLVARRRGDPATSGTSATRGRPRGRAPRRGGRRVPVPRGRRARRRWRRRRRWRTARGGRRRLRAAPEPELAGGRGRSVHGRAARASTRARDRGALLPPPRDLRTGDAPGDEPGDEPGDDPGDRIARFLRFGRLGPPRWRHAWTSRRDADTSAAMRGAARGSRRARAATASEHDPSLPDLQVGLAVAGGYFGQEGA